MLIAATVAGRLGIAAEGRSLEQIATPLSAEDEDEPMKKEVTRVRSWQRSRRSGTGKRRGRSFLRPSCISEAIAPYASAQADAVSLDQSLPATSASVCEQAGADPFVHLARDTIPLVLCAHALQRLGEPGPVLDAIEHGDQSLGQHFFLRGMLVRPNSGRTWDSASKSTS